MTSQIKDSAFYTFFIDNPENHSLQINGQMKNSDTKFRYRKYCKSQTVDVRFPWNTTKVHFRVRDHNDLKLGFDLGQWKLGKFEATYFAKVFSVDKKLQYQFGLQKEVNKQLWHSVWVSFNSGLFINYNFNITKSQWYIREGIKWNTSNHQFNFDGLFNYTQNLNEFFIKASNSLDTKLNCKDQEIKLGYLRRRGNDKACGFLVDNKLNVDLICHAKVKKCDWRFFINKSLEVRQYVRYNYNDSLTIHSGISVPLKTIGKVCPLTYLTALQVELNI
ncbi:unnamed protein product [Paramecium pentaurelia]|uniref:Uncharacterized protein n=1 Tax=Paramecium pentaurelia TaxID=43138 RepID=A0A8S1UFL5_9CILI|nr:unnamed protein product [Paramecium pentaurelia]